MSVYQEVKRRIIADIESLPPHTRLPARPLLCEQYFASRTTIDRVVTSLCAEGYLYAVHKSGTYVADPALNLSVPSGASGRHIGVILPTHGINSSALIEQSMIDYARVLGYKITLCSSDHNALRQHSLVRRLINEGVDGIILQPPTLHAAYHETSALLVEKQIPTVFLFARLPDMRTMPLVAPNNITSGLERMRHLMVCGYKRIACVSNHGDESIESCLGCYLASQQLFNLAHDDAHVLIQERVPREQFVQQIIDMLSLANAPDAFYCFNDSMAGIVYEALARMELRVSDDVGVIGSDNSLACDQMTPPLTSMDIQAYRLGRTALDVLMQFDDFGSPPPLHTLFEPQLYVRGSCLGPHKRV